MIRHFSSCLLFLATISANASASTITITDTITINQLPKATITATHIYEGDPDNGYRAVGGSYDADVEPIHITHNGRVQVQPPNFPDPAVYQDRTIEQTIEFLQWPAFAGSAATSDIVRNGAETGFLTTVLSTTEVVARVKLEGPATTWSAIVTIGPIIPFEPAYTVVNADGSLDPGSYFSRFSMNLQPKDSHDGVFIPAVPLSMLSAIVPLSAGDVNADGQTTFADFLVLSSNFNTDGLWRDGDVDLDGHIGFADFLLLASNFETSPAAAAAVPEPSSLMLWLGFGSLLLRRTRRVKSPGAGPPVRRPPS